MLTKSEQDRPTPDEALQSLLEGNQRFVSGTLTPRDYPGQVREASTSQYPEAVNLCCIDSRIPVATVFDPGIGDVIRTGQVDGIEP